MEQKFTDKEISDALEDANNINEIFSDIMGMSECKFIGLLAAASNAIRMYKTSNKLSTKYRDSRANEISKAFAVMFGLEV